MPLGRLIGEPSLVSTARDAPLGNVAVVESGTMVLVPGTWMPPVEE